HGLGRLPLLLQAAAESEVRIVVHRLQLEDLAELRLCLGEALDPEVRDAERLADRGLLGLAPLRLLERDGRLGGPSAREVLLPLSVEVVGLAHTLLQRYGKFSTTTSSGRVRSRVGPTSRARTSVPASSSSRRAEASSYGGPGTRSSPGKTLSAKNQ